MDSNSITKWPWETWATSAIRLYFEPVTWVLAAFRIVARTAVYVLAAVALAWLLLLLVVAAAQNVLVLFYLVAVAVIAAPLAKHVFIRIVKAREEHRRRVA